MYSSQAKLLVISESLCKCDSVTQLLIREQAKRTTIHSPSYPSLDEGNHKPRMNCCQENFTDGPCSQQESSSS